MTTHWADIDLLSVSSLEAPVFKREWFTITMGFDYYHERDWWMVGLISVLTIILLGMIISLIVSYLAYFKSKKEIG